MLFSNRELDRAFAFIARTDFDIFCLQEVPEEFLERLKALVPHIAYAPDTTLRFKGIISTQYLVILSRYPIRDAVIHEIPHREPFLSERGRLFARFMFAVGLLAEGLGNRHWIEAAIESPAFGTIHVYDLRLPLTNLARRAEEFETILAHSAREYPAIICGDFNILESPHITTLNWFLGGRVTDALFFRRERTRFEEQFAAHGLKNALRGKITHSLSRSQLDHILVSKIFSIKNTEVVPDCFGSDHHPIRVELT